MIFFEYLIIIIGIYLSVYVLYNIMLLLVHFFIKEDDSPMPKPKTRFGIVIPAHNEELLLARLLKSIKSQNYPSALLKTIVVADNCTDNTSKVGLELGALVLERRDTQHQGKGYALKWAVEKADLNEYDAIFIVDADCILESDVLMQMNKAIFEGKTIIQCFNSAYNHDQSWFTRLIDVSNAVSNYIYHPAKQVLGFSSTLMGNGMCFSKELLFKYGWDAFTVGEDWEYYARLIQKGETIAFAKTARVFHQESSSLKQATSQRMRWSSGRFAIAWNYGFSLFFRGLVERNLIKLDASLPLILPNPSLGVNITVFFLVLSLLLQIFGGKMFFVLWFLCLMMVQLLIYMIGITYTQNKLKKFLAIFIAPMFLIWKIGVDILSAMGMGREKWTRTERKL